MPELDATDYAAGLSSKQPIKAGQTILLIQVAAQRQNRPGRPCQAHRAGAIGSRSAVKPQIRLREPQAPTSREQVDSKGYELNSGKTSRHSVHSVWGEPHQRVQAPTCPGDTANQRFHSYNNREPIRPFTMHFTAENAEITKYPTFFAGPGHISVPNRHCQGAAEARGRQAFCLPVPQWIPMMLHVDCRANHAPTS
jgi:hypothetical protein